MSVEKETNLPTSVTSVSAIDTDINITGSATGQTANNDREHRTRESQASHAPGDKDVPPGYAHRQVRTWFEGLSPTDRMAAASLTDEAFLATIAEVVSSAAPESAKGRQEVIVSWDRLVSFASLRQIYESQVNQPVVSSDKMNGSGKSHHGKSKTNDKEAGADVLRIRPHSSVGSVPPMSPLAAVSLVLPGVIDYYCGKDAEDTGAQPVLTLSPFAMEPKHGRPLLDGFDQAMRQALGSAFLSVDIEPKYDWMERLSSSPDRLTLGAVVLARMEGAIVQSFVKETKGTIAVEGVDRNEVPKSVDEESSMTQNTMTVDSEMSSEERTLGEAEDPSKPVDTPTLKDLATKLKALTDQLPLELKFESDSRLLLERLMNVRRLDVIDSKNLGFVPFAAVLECLIDPTSGHVDVARGSSILSSVAQVMEAIVERPAAVQQSPKARRRKNRAAKKKRNKQTNAGAESGAVSNGQAGSNGDRNSGMLALTASRVFISHGATFDSADSTTDGTNSVAQPEQQPNPSSEDGIQVSREGVYVVSTVGADIDYGGKPQLDEAEALAQAGGDVWEKVNIKPKSNRRKGNDKPGSANKPSGSSGSDGQPGSPKRSKNVRASKKKNAVGRKTANDVSKLVDDEPPRHERPSVAEQRPVPLPAFKQEISAPPARPAGNPWSTGPPSTVNRATSLPSLLSEETKKTSSPKDGSTLPETESSSSNIVSSGDQGKRLLTKEDSSSGVTEEEPLNSRKDTTRTQQAKKSSPPLSTLLAPDHGQSAPSSVASSLEPPNASGRLRGASSADADNVGYHVLSVCDRLSREIEKFMKFRAFALNQRRRERGALLAALQDSVTSIWPGLCHVDMYGSCATQLDLPSSDLDVVVVGLDRNLDLHRASSERSQGSKGTPEDIKDAPAVGPVAPNTPYAVYRKLQVDRIKRLAAELETQPWAVQVNALPKASVPVVKILADPSKLTGSGQEWLRQHQLYAAQAAVAAGLSVPQASSKDASSPDVNQMWRGADVMNGLLSLDITFEGPEHGGIGSTQFSARVVNEACHEANAPPEATPFVQVLMVLKELLAQRKLNEPYSGGLSSYSVLLLLVALLRERAMIRGELERTERQKQAVSAGTGSVYKSSPVDGHAASGSAAAPAPTMTHASSWASIAKKPSTEALVGPKLVAESSKESDGAKSFADAVAKPAASPKPTPPPSRQASPSSSPQRDTTSNSKNASLSSTGGQQADAPASSSTASPVAPSFFNQSYNDIIEVLCSGPTTPGKLLMHFFLYYGHYFDAQNTSIDISGKHKREGPSYPYSLLSPFIKRIATGSIDPRTGMLTIDPIVIYDPLEGAEMNNVAKRCFAWSSVKWLFANSYNTLSKVVEASVAPSETPDDANGASLDEDASVDLTDPSSPLLKCLLSY